LLVNNRTASASEIVSTHFHPPTVMKWHVVKAHAPIIF
jgi:hypothetical protein